MNLVIVESPAKAKTINNYLGKDFKVLASLGHIMDLPSKDGSVLPERDFEMKYELNEKSKKYVKEIKELAKKSDAIYLATDPDREGESIAWHVAQVIKDTKGFKDATPIKRIAFNEITKQSVKQALQNPRELDDDLIGAQQARRALDYLVGFTLSPLLWRKMPGCKSAGRVQSVALRLICEREDSIEAFVPREYWSITLGFANSANKKFAARLFEFKGKKLDKFDIPNKDQADLICSAIKDSSFVVEKIDKKQQRRNPSAPFITSTMQQEASRKLGFNAKKTMQIAQKLYEGIEVDGQTLGLITYMRTDGVTIAEEALSQIRSYIKDKIGSQYLPNNPRAYSSKVKNAQEAHEAIRPTNIDLTPEKLVKALDKDHLALYQLIWNRTVACQMESAILDTVSVVIKDHGNNRLKATGSVIAFDGFYKIYKEGVDAKENDLDDDPDDDERILPPLSVGETLKTDKITPKQHFTEPQPRYTEASLVKKLEELGIGRPSTYASIISVLQERDYVKMEKKAFIPQQKGRLVTAFLINFFKKYVEYDFTADLENELDEVANGHLNWKELLRRFWNGFISNIDTVKDYKISDIISTLDQFLSPQLFPPKEDGSDSRLCTSCNTGHLSLKFGKFGAFIACSNYPTCNYTKPILNDVNQDEATTNSNNQVLGEIDGKALYLKKGPYGWYLQLGDSKEDLKRVAMPKGYTVENMTFEVARNLLSLPRSVGSYEGEEVFVNIGRYGPYLKVGTKLIPLKKHDPFSISSSDALKIVHEKINLVSEQKKPEFSKTKKEVAPKTSKSGKEDKSSTVKKTKKAVKK